MQPTLFPVEDYHSMIPTEKRLRGNPNFKPVYSDKTTVIRVPIHLKEQIKDLAKRLDQGECLDSLDFNSVTEKKPLTVCELPIDQIHCDPYRFQFKLVHNGSTGSTGSLKGINVWNPDLAGIILVWLDPLDGKTYVINGHNRLDKALSFNVKTLAVRYIQASNAKLARLIGAMANIADGKGTALDAAKILRDGNLTANDLKSYGVTLKDNLASQGIAIANLLPFLFEKTLLGELDQKVAIAIGKVDQSLQTELYNLIKKDKRSLSQSVLDELVAIVQNSVTEQTLDLFGNAQSESTAIYKAELISYIKQRLTKESHLFKTVSRSKNKTILERGNNSIDQGTSSMIAEQSGNVLMLFEQLKNQTSDVSYWLNYYSDKLKSCNGKESEAIKTEAYDRIWAVLNVDSILDLVG